MLKAHTSSFTRFAIERIGHPCPLRGRLVAALVIIATRLNSVRRVVHIPVSVLDANGGRVLHEVLCCLAGLTRYADFTVKMNMAKLHLESP